MSSWILGAASISVLSEGFRGTSSPSRMANGLGAPGTTASGGLGALQGQEELLRQLVPPTRAPSPSPSPTRSLWPSFQWLFEAKTCSKGGVRSLLARLQDRKGAERLLLEQVVGLLAPRIKTQPSYQSHQSKESPTCPCQAVVRPCWWRCVIIRKWMSLPQKSVARSLRSLSIPK